MAEYYLRPAQATSSGPLSGDVKLEVTSDVITISIYGSGKWTTQTISATSQTPAFSQHTNAAAFPVAGTTSRLYLALDTEILYYWNGSAYAQCVGGT